MLRYSVNEKQNRKMFLISFTCFQIQIKIIADMDGVGRPYWVRHLPLLLVRDRTCWYFNENDYMIILKWGFFIQLEDWIGIHLLRNEIHTNFHTPKMFSEWKHISNRNLNFSIQKIYKNLGFSKVHIPQFCLLL